MLSCGFNTVHKVAFVHGMISSHMPSSSLQARISAVRAKRIKPSVYHHEPKKESVVTFCIFSSAHTNRTVLATSKCFLTHSKFIFAKLDGTLNGSHPLPLFSISFLEFLQSKWGILFDPRKLGSLISKLTESVLSHVLTCA